MNPPLSAHNNFQVNHQFFRPELTQQEKLVNTLKFFEENNTDGSKDEMITRIKAKLTELAMVEAEDLLK